MMSHAADMALDEKLAFLRESRHAFGRTALVLSGGGSFGAFHMASAPGLGAGEGVATAVRAVLWCFGVTDDEAAENPNTRIADLGPAPSCLGYTPDMPFILRHSFRRLPSPKPSPQPAHTRTYTRAASTHQTANTPTTHPLPPSFLCCRAW